MSKTLLDVANVIDSLHATPEYVGDGIPMVRVVDINNNFLDLEDCLLVDENTCNKHNKNHIPHRGDIVITRVGSYGMVAYVDTDERFCLGQNIAIVSPESEEDGRFIYYYLQSPYMQRIIYGTSGGSSYKCIGLEQIREFPMVDENIEYKKVGELLYQIDKKIDINNKINDELESMAKTIYDYWFLQFEFPNEEGKPYKSSGGKMVWNEELKREIPEGWEACSLEMLGKLTMGQSPKSDSYNEHNEGYPLINGAAELKSDAVIITKYTNKPTRVCRKGELIFCIRATIGNLRYADREYCLGRGVAAFSSNRAEMKEYLVGVLRNILDKYEKTLSGSIIIGISKDDLKEEKIITPATGIISKYSSIVGLLFKKMEKAYKENKELSSLRDFLLPLLMNGQVGFKD